MMTDGLRDDVTVTVGAVFATVTTVGAEGAGLLFVSPEVVAVMGSVPTGRVEVTSVAVLLRPLPGVRMAVPIVVVPSKKATEPVGAALLLETVAVKVTG